jgi:hypothetical protein
MRVILPGTEAPIVILFKPGEAQRLKNDIWEAGGVIFPADEKGRMHALVQGRVLWLVPEPEEEGAWSNRSA